MIKNNPDDEELTVRALKQSNVGSAVPGMDGHEVLRNPLDFKQFREVGQQLGLYWLVVNEEAPA